MAARTSWRSTLRRLAARGGLRIDRLDDTSFLVQRGSGPHRVPHQIGPDTARTHVVRAPGALARHPRAVQVGLGAYAGAEHAAWMMRRLGVNVALDVGANVGQYATSLRRHGYRGRIVSFEPLPWLAEELREQAASDEDWQVLEHALGADDGTAEINARPGTMSSMLPSSDFGQGWHENLRESHKQTITVRRLDSVYDEVVAGIAEPRAYLKLDTQGFDLEAFRGAEGCLDDVLAMQSEVAMIPIYEGMPGLVEVLAIYEDAGFAINGMFPVSFDHPTGRVIEFDMMLIRHRPEG